MKKILYIALTAAVVAGCSKETGEPQGGRIAAQFSDAAITRATATAWETGDQIGVYMVGAGATTLTDAAAIDGAKNISYTVSAAGASGTFSPTAASQAIYFPVNGDAVDFYAYYPHSTATTDGIYKIDITDQTNLPAIDLMTAKVTGKSKASPAVPFQFSHRLSKVKLTLKAGDGLSAADIADVAVSIVGTSPTADYNIATDAITAPATAAAITAVQVVDPTNAAQRTAEAILIPQTGVSGVRLEFKISGYDTFTATLPSSTTSFESGKQYGYTITISQTAATITAQNITPWTSGNGAGEGGEATLVYSVGDYYPDPSVTFSGGVVTSGTAPVGIVFWLDNPVGGKSAHGKIVSLDENSNVQWSTEYEFRNATDADNGVANMATIKAINSDFSNYPAFKWCADKTTGGKTWYLPARNELKALYAAMSGLRWIASGTAGTGEIADWGNNTQMPNYGNYSSARDAFNNKFTAASGTKIDLGSGDSPWYWSSTESDYYDAWYVVFDRGVSNDGVKVNGDRVLAVSAF